MPLSNSLLPDSSNEAHNEDHTPKEDRRSARGRVPGGGGDQYGQSCRDVSDCRPVADFVETVVNGKPIVRLLIDGTWVTVSRSYVVAAHASDGRAHFCGKLHFPGRQPSRGTRANLAYLTPRSPY
jgi:hypothetical protein